MLTSALNGPSPDGGDTYFSHAPRQHGSLPSPNPACQRPFDYRGRIAAAFDARSSC
jgi:hypothetical protein